jgi:hypothetical protein
LIFSDFSDFFEFFSGVSGGGAVLVVVARRTTV